LIAIFTISFIYPCIIIFVLFLVIST
jgi:hypothetical protein